MCVIGKHFGSSLNCCWTNLLFIGDSETEFAAFSALARRKSSKGIIELSGLIFLLTKDLTLEDGAV